MDIYVLDGLNGAIGMFDNYQSVIWNKQYFGQDDLQLVTAATEENLELLQIGKLLVRDMDITEDGYKNLMLIQSRSISFDDETGWMLTITGKGLKNLLARRIIWAQLNYDNVTIEDMIRDVITQNVISPSDSNRAIDNFVLGDKQNFTDTAEIQLFSENIAEWLENICTQYNYGWDVVIKNNQYVFILYKGTDRSYNQDAVAPVVFSPEYDNLYSSTYSHNQDNYVNAALVGGEGDGTQKRTTTIGEATGLDRYEGYIDGSSVSSNGEIITLDTYLNLLKSYGEEQIKQFQKTQTFEGEIEPNGMYKLNVDYFLGDVVQIENEKGIQATPRITEIIYSEDSNGVSIVPTFSEWEVN